jgi:parvulin-like peptidyl-prolyl isomerase
LSTLLASAVAAQTGMCGLAAPPAADELVPKPDERPIAARIGQQPVYVEEVERELGPVEARSKIPASMLPRWQAQALDLVLDRRIVLEMLERKERAATPAEIDSAVKQVKEQLVERKLTWEQFLAQQQTTEAALREQIRWQMSWNRYAARELTDDVLEDLFKSQPADYDGRKIRVSHILLRPVASGGDKEIQSLVRRAAELRERIERKELTFAEAAARHSDAPSKAEGGDIGSIGRHGDMVEPFAQAAFALAKREISPPVVTPFGVHLIQCTELDPGSKTAADNRDELRKEAALLLFKRIAAQERGGAEISFTGVWPYFDPETRKLVTPKP